ncbi:MAG: sigma-70 family RNA polymerase sigma factor [Clostridia bacterium]|nr:sigma-70 family RNA polymerase sigma factor [Clostridia bacterium]
MVSTEILEQKIIGLFWARRESAISEFEKQYKNLCLKLARDITGSEETAEECLNDLYLRLWNSIPPEKPLSLKSYACRIIRNLALHQLEKQTAQKRSAVLTELDECIASSAVSETIASSEAEEESREIGRMIDAFLETLPKREALVFVRRYFYSDSVKAIAQRSGLKENKISKMLAKTRKALKVYLERGGYTV